MSSNRDHDLLAFLLGELGVLKRLDVRLRLAFSSSARRRLTELERAAGAIAGTIGAGGVAAFRANRQVKLRRLLLLDLAVAAALLSSVGGGGAVVWRTLHPAASPDACGTGSTAVVTIQAPVKPVIKPHAPLAPPVMCAIGALTPLTDHATVTQAHKHPSPLSQK